MKVFEGYDKTISYLRVLYDLSEKGIQLNFPVTKGVSLLLCYFSQAEVKKKKSTVR